MLYAINDGAYEIGTVTGDDRFPNDVLYARVPSEPTGEENG